VTPSHPYLLSTPATPVCLYFAEDTTTIMLLINSLAFIEPLLADRPHRWPLPPPAVPTASPPSHPPRLPQVACAADRACCQRREPLTTATVSRAHHCAHPWAAVPAADSRRRPPAPPNSAPTVGHLFRPRPLSAAFVRCPRWQHPLRLANASKCLPWAARGERNGSRPQRGEGHAAARRGGGRCLLATPPIRSAGKGRRGR